jgi:hypothetical protein
LDWWTYKKYGKNNFRKIPDKLLKKKECKEIYCATVSYNVKLSCKEIYCVIVSYNVKLSYKEIYSIIVSYNVFTDVNFSS